MRTKMAWVAGVIVVALGLTVAGTSLAQTTTTVGTRNFEVVAVDGNKLIVKDEKGTQEITVPDDFRFTVDGKKMAVSDLKPGTKGTATITTTTTIKQVAVTESARGVVCARRTVFNDRALTRTACGRVDTEQLDKGCQILKDGRAVRMDESQTATKFRRRSSRQRAGGGDRAGSAGNARRVQSRTRPDESADDHRCRTGRDPARGPAPRPRLRPRRHTSSGA